MRRGWRGTDGDGAYVEARIRKPAVVDRGYTPHTMVTEWLTLNCRGWWACQSGAASLRVRFSEKDDLERALGVFGGGSL